MFDESIQAIAGAAKKKADFLSSSILKYTVSSMFAGFFIGIGIILIFTIGGILTPAASPYTKILMGVSFAVALSLVIFTGTDLFTGNNMVMTVGCINKTVSGMDLLKVWIVSYIGNLLGAILISFLFVQTGLIDKGPVTEFFKVVAMGKASAPFASLFFRGVMCNILVCLAVLIGFRTKDDTAKLIIIFMCLFAFITSGFEHSIANMTVYGVALMSNAVEGITMSHALANLIPVTLGNIVGGAVLVGGGYSFLKSKQAA